VAKKAHFWISDTRLEYYGYCQECRKKWGAYSVGSLYRGWKYKFFFGF
jgi:hypothetical protein